MDLHEYLGVLRRCVVFIVLGVVIGLLGGAAVQSMEGPSYSAASRNLVTSGGLLPNVGVAPISKPLATMRIEATAMPKAPLPSNGGVILIVGGVLGLAVGLLAASLREAVRIRLRGRKDLAAAAHIPVIGDISADQSMRSTPVVARAGSGAHNPAVETPVAVAPASPTAPAAAPVAAPAMESVARHVTTPAHLSGPIPEPTPVGTELAIVTRGTPRGSHRRVTAPAGASAAPAKLVGLAAAVDGTAPLTAAKRPVPAEAPVEAPVIGEPAAASIVGVTAVEHTIGSARDLDFAFAALPTATAAEKRAGALRAELDDSMSVPTLAPAAPEVPATVETRATAGMVERPIVIKPDAPRPVSRFAPDPARFTQRMSGAYANAPAPAAGTAGKIPAPQVTGTVVNTVSIRVQRDVIEAQTVQPPIRHILPRPIGVTAPPRAVEAASWSGPEPEPDLVELRPRTGPVPVPPLVHERLPVHEPEFAVEPEIHDRVMTGPVGVVPHLVPDFIHDPNPVAASGTRANNDPTAETRAIPTFGGSLLGEIGGLPRVEVRAPRVNAVTDTAPNPERDARESYEHRARQLERVAHERLMREQQRLAVDIREQLAHDKRELESVLDNRLEDTVWRPIMLGTQRPSDPRFSDPSDDDGQTR